MISLTFSSACCCLQPCPLRASLHLLSRWNGGSVSVRVPLGRLAPHLWLSAVPLGLINPSCPLPHLPPPPILTQTSPLQLSLSLTLLQSQTSPASVFPILQFPLVLLVYLCSFPPGPVQCVHLAVCLDFLLLLASGALCHCNSGVSQANKE